MAKTEKQQAQDPQLDDWGDPIPPPPIVEGYVHPMPGLILIGVVLSREKGEKYGPYYVLKVQHEVEVSQGGEYVTLPAGSTVGISETSGMRPLADRMAKSKVALRVRMHFKGKLPDKSWDLDLRAVPAF